MDEGFQNYEELSTGTKCKPPKVMGSEQSNCGVRPVGEKSTWEKIKKLFRTTFDPVEWVQEYEQAKRQSSVRHKHHAVAKYETYGTPSSTS